jgi:hypothetical protein
MNLQMIIPIIKNHLLNLHHFFIFHIYFQVYQFRFFWHYVQIFLQNLHLFSIRLFYPIFYPFLGVF